MVAKNWMRNLCMVEFLEFWEPLHNLDFNYIEFDVIDKKLKDKQERI